MAIIKSIIARPGPPGADGGGLASVSADPSPTLGGDLDLDGHAIPGVTDAIARVDPGTTGTLAQQVVNDPAGTGTVWVDDLLNIMAYGAVNDGEGTDDTEAFEAAWADCITYRKGLYIPSGPGFSYTGTGLTGNAYPVVVGDGAQQSTIYLGSTSYLVASDELVGETFIQGLNVTGGYGVVRLTYTGSNVQGHHTIRDFYFSGYTRCAIEHNSSDMPYWVIENGHLVGEDYLLTMGIALNGLADKSVLRSITCPKNRVGIKLGNGGGNAIVDNCDFIRFGTDRTNGPAVGLWIVPKASSVGAGPGTIISAPKFGNENLVAGDRHVLYADEGAGATNGARFPELASASTGYVDGVTYREIAWGMTSGIEPSLVYSLTPNVRRNDFGFPVLDGGPAVDASYLLEFDALAMPGNDEFVGSNVYDGIRVLNGTIPVPRASNAPGVVAQRWNRGHGQDYRERRDSLGLSSTYVRLMSQSVNAPNLLSTSTATPTTDGLGGTDAAVLSLAAGFGNGAYLDFSPVPTEGRPVWVEVELAAPGTGTAAQSIQFHVRGGTGHLGYHSSHFRVPSDAEGWVGYWFCFEPRDINAYLQLQIQNNEAGTRTAKVGRIRAYHADGRVQGGQLLPAYTVSNLTTDRAFDANSTTLDEVADVLGTLIADLKAKGL